MWSDPTTLRRSKPSLNKLVQWITDKRGRKIWQDVSGDIGEAGLSYFQDNGQGKKPREVQEGKGHNYTGIETITFPDPVTSIEDQDGNDLSSYLSGQTLTPPPGDIFAYLVNDTDQYDLEDTAGLIAYRDKTPLKKATINLNGSSESNFYIRSNQVPSVQNKIGFGPPGTDPTNLTAYVPIDQSENGKTTVTGIEVAYNQYGPCQYPMQVKNSGCISCDANLLLFDGSGHTEYETEYPEYEIEFINDRTDFPFTIWEYNYNFITVDASGFTLTTYVGGGLRMTYTISEGVPGTLIFNFGISPDKVYKLHVKRVLGGNWEYTCYEDGVFLSSGSADPGNGMYWKSNTAYTAIGLRSQGNPANSGDQKWGGKILRIQTWNTDGAGTRISSPFFVTGSERDGPIFFNKAINRPANSDLTTYLNGSTEGSQRTTDPHQYPYPIVEGFSLNGDVVVPADPANPGFDVEGNPLQFKGSKRTLNPEPGTLGDRNPFNAPALVAAGIPQGEDRPIDEWDNSSFQDIAEENRTQSMLVYSDFPEPIAGSAAYFDGIITASVAIAKSVTDFIHQTGIFNISFYASFENGADAVNADEMLWTCAPVGVTTGFNMYYGNSAAGAEGKISFRLGIGTAATTYATGDLSSDLEDGKLHLIQYVGDGVDIKINVDGVEQFSGGLVLGGGTSDSALQIATSHRGMLTMPRIVNNIGEEPISYPTAEENGLTWFNTGLNSPTGSDVTISMNGAAAGTQFVQDANVFYQHNLDWGYHDDGTSLVPGDPSNPGKDVNDDDIDNPEQVKKKRIIDNYLRR